MSKKILSLTLAVLMIFSIAIPVFAAAAPERFNVVALGDSVPAAYGVKEGEGYAEILSAILTSAKPDSKLTNLAVSGATTSDLITLLGTNEAKTALGKANIITLNIGGNNLLVPVVEILQEQLAALGITDLTKVSAENFAALIPEKFNKAQRETFAAGVAKFKTDMPAILGKIKELAPEAELFVNTVYNPAPVGNPLNALIDSYIKEINQVIKTSQRFGNYAIIDVYAAFAAEPNATNFIPAAGLYDIHPNAAGHLIIAKEIAKAVSTEYSITAVEKAAGLMDKQIAAAIKAFNAAVAAIAAEKAAEVTAKPVEETVASVTEEATEKPAETAPVEEVAPVEETAPVEEAAEPTEKETAEEPEFDEILEVNLSVLKEALATRAQAMNALMNVYSVLGISVKDLENSELFADVSENHRAFDAIMTAKNLGIIKGTNENKFKPNSYISKQDFAIFLSRVLDLSDIEFSASQKEIKDIDKVSSYAQDAVAAVVNLGILKTDAKGNFNPADGITAADMIMISYTIKGLIK